MYVFGRFSDQMSLRSGPVDRGSGSCLPKGPESFYYITC